MRSTGAACGARCAAAAGLLGPGSWGGSQLRGGMVQPHDTCMGSASACSPFPAAPLQTDIEPCFQLAKRQRVAAREEAWAEELAAAEEQQDKLEAAGAQAHGARRRVVGACACVPPRSASAAIVALSGCGGCVTSVHTPLLPARLVPRCVPCARRRRRGRHAQSGDRYRDWQPAAVHHKRAHSVRPSPLAAARWSVADQQGTPGLHGWCRSRGAAYPTCVACTPGHHTWPPRWPTPAPPLPPAAGTRIRRRTRGIPLPAASLWTG